MIESLNENFYLPISSFLRLLMQQSCCLISSPYIRMFIECNQKKHIKLVIECKRVKDTSWIFMRDARFSKNSKKTGSNTVALPTRLTEFCIRD